MMNSVWSWFWGSSSETISLRLKGKLDSLEISNAVIGTEIFKGASWTDRRGHDWKREIRWTATPSKSWSLKNPRKL